MKITPLDALIMEQEGLRSLSKSDIGAMQLKKLNMLLQREKQRGGFYGKLPERLDSLGQLCALPFTTDEDLAANAPSMLLTSQGDIQRVLSDATSGTTGRAKRVFYTAADCENTVRLFMAGLSELVFPGSVTLICMPFSGPHGLGELIAEAIERLGARPVKAGAGLSYGELEKLLEHERPDSFVGMPVQLLSLLRFCGRKSLRRALVSGDSCGETVIKECEAILGSRLFPHYGSREMALGGAICCEAHEGMHMRDNHVICEIVDTDGKPLPEGEYGELVITTIGMEALPLIRYRSGDYTRILPAPCPCGSHSTRLDTVRRLAASDMEALDDKLFRLTWLADYKAATKEGLLHIDALCLPDTDAAAAAAELQGMLSCAAKLSLRPVAADDGPLYRGKRVVECLG